jgi:uncharacterized SAM-binding protein YcdF (DUF218 family)
MVMVEREGATSAESIHDASVIMRARKLHSALLVSDSYHMLRLEMLARRAGILGFRAPATTPIDKTPKLRWRYILKESVVFPVTALVGGK